eukprot:snap_masked-scaffold_39-processed-gene-1.35-mRNA-1 protein AED:1.00 eAED:1.00 QI:0/0/0/0/1/1/3/0/245
MVLRSQRAFYGLKEAPFKYEGTDDMLFASQFKENLQWILNQLKLHYDVKNTMTINNYVGFEISEDENYIYLTAEGYIKKLAETFEITEKDVYNISHIVNHYIDQVENSNVLDFKRKFQSLVGSITYICRVCRPDISFQTNMLAQCSNKTTVSHLNAGKRVIEYLFNTYSLGLKYKKNVTEFKVEAYSDASHVSLRGIYSVSGYIIKINGSTLLYKTKKQRYIATGSTEAGIIACSLTVKELNGYR